MEGKPVPKPRSLKSDRPIPAPRNIQAPSLPPVSPSVSPSESSHLEMNEDTRSSETRGTPEFFRGLSNSGRNFKDEISEKMTVKGKAVISSTRNASIRLEKSVKNLLTRRMTSLNSEDIRDSPDGKSKEPTQEDRCVSMPADDIFSSISFYSPLQSNLRSMKNEENLSEARYSPPPPIYPPPPLPDESIYDELQSVTSGHSSRYDTLSSTVSEHAEMELPDSFNLLNFAQNQGSDSDQSLNLSDVSVTVNEKSEAPKRLSRSDSWTFYDMVPEKVERLDKNEELDVISSADESEKEASIKQRISTISNVTQFSIQNSLYENWMLRKPIASSPSDKPNSEDRTCSKSLLFEFDPFARNDENIYSNYENNDLMLLESLLATSDSPSSTGSMADLCEEEEAPEETEEDIKVEFGEISVTPPELPKRFDSLPKNEYDEVEMVEVQDKSSSKIPAVLPKLVHLSKKKQPAIPPRKPSIKIHVDEKDKTEGSNVNTNASNKPNEESRSSVMQKLKKFRQDSTANVKPMSSNMMNFMKSRKILSRNKEGEVGTKCSPRLERPKFMGQSLATQRWVVYKQGTGIERAKDLVLRAAYLADNKLSFYVDKKMTTLKEVIQLELVHSVHLLQDVKTVDGETVHCVAINGEGRPGVHIIYLKGITERRIFAQKVLEALTPVFPAKYTTELTMAGWAYLKEGVTGSWFPAWLLLQQRTLIHTRSMDPVVFEQLDLRKARYIGLREQEGPNSSGTNVPVVVVDAGGRGALHIATPGLREGPAWRHALYQAATNNGPALEQQQLTKDNVPVVLDKCINFIYAHGIMSEGIYRRSGSSSAVVRLLEEFRRNAWATQITRSEYSEHDVATVLRRFLRDLPDPLFPANIHEQLCRLTDVNNEESRVSSYRKLLIGLNPVTSATLRRILAHLHCLSQQNSRNLMTVDNVAAVWGPTLMHAGENNPEEWNRSETKVVADLIRLYPKLYQLSPADLAKEAKILEVLERHHVSNNRPRGAPSGDLKIWIYIMARDGECVNVTIGPQKTAFDVCCELAKKTKFAPHELCLEESALSGALERPLHHSERILETVARWGYWNTADRKDNALVLQKDRIYKDIVPLVKPPMTISGELKFADTKSKHFKSYLFEFSQAKLCCYKDKVCCTKLHEWRIEDIVWYLGHEPKRNPQMGWCITFIIKSNKPSRCKDNPFFGYTLAGACKDEEYRWLAAMLFGEHQLNLRPSPVNLMDP
ncbi:uncharacterized protein LOC107273795 isoform X2 [Cephus cinctus]|uniref:Uncharacterized protein LOC107273795 isoform X2 n=1 Tax=Cephus cinctus TaxID=211228 RepID=A0AAJ7FTS7_CEPCN|nr:uncharacterized protein LOC107273795 isoform X2 [Cephus cinctus]